MGGKSGEMNTIKLYKLSQYLVLKEKKKDKKIYKYSKIENELEL